jgi:hypothetical protein
MQSAITMSVDPPSNLSRATATEEMRFNQYKLALEMITKMSDHRQASNRFFIGLLSGFGALYSVLLKAKSSETRTMWEHVLPILPVGLCVTWWLLITSYRHVTDAKRAVIYKLEEKLPEQPFSAESRFLRGEPLDHDLHAEGGHVPARIAWKTREFSITRIERSVPIVIGLIFLFLFVLPFF